MSSSKRYYWLKLNETFFEDDTIEWIEEQENGERYVLFYLKLCLKSLKDEGSLIRYVGEMLIPYDVKALAKLTNTDQDTVTVSLRVFEEIGLIERRDSGEIYMKQINEMIGSETDTAKRVRKHRARRTMLQSNSDSLQSNKKMLQGNTAVTKCNTEIEIEIENRDKREELDSGVEDVSLRKEDIELIIKKWNELNLQQLVAINRNTKRYGMLKNRIKEFSLDKIIEAIDNIGKSKFLQGQNDRGWTITFDWFVRPNNFLKVLEGNYDNKESKVINTNKKTDYSVNKIRDLDYLVE